MFFAKRKKSDSRIYRQLPYLMICIGILLILDEKNRSYVIKAGSLFINHLSILLFGAGQLRQVESSQNIVKSLPTNLIPHVDHLTLSSKILKSDPLFDCPAQIEASLENHFNIVPKGNQRIENESVVISIPKQVVLKFEPNQFAYIDAIQNTKILLNVTNNQIIAKGQINDISRQDFTITICQEGLTTIPVTISMPNQGYQQKCDIATSKWDIYPIRDQYHLPTKRSKAILGIIGDTSPLILESDLCYSPSLSSRDCYPNLSAFSPIALEVGSSPIFSASLVKKTSSSYQVTFRFNTPPFYKEGATDVSYKYYYSKYHCYSSLNSFIIFYTNRLNAYLPIKSYHQTVNSAELVSPFSTLQLTNFDLLNFVHYYPIVYINGIEMRPYINDDSSFLSLDQLIPKLSYVTSCRVASDQLELAILYGDKTRIYNPMVRTLARLNVTVNGQKQKPFFYKSMPDQFWGKLSTINAEIRFNHDAKNASVVYDYVSTCPNEDVLLTKVETPLMGPVDFSFNIMRPYFSTQCEIQLIINQCGVRDVISIPVPETITSSFNLFFLFTLTTLNTLLLLCRYCCCNNYYIDHEKLSQIILEWRLNQPMISLRREMPDLSPKENISNFIINQPEIWYELRDYLAPECREFIDKNRRHMFAELLQNN